MLILACRKCGELKVLAGAPDPNGTARVMWTCSKCGMGQLLELSISKDARRGDLRSVVGGLALAKKSALRGKYFFVRERREGISDDI